MISIHLLLLFKVLFVCILLQGLSLAATSCDKATSMSSQVTNSFCRQLCESGKTNTQEFSLHCSFVKWWIENGGLKADNCYAMHVYGYQRYEADRMKVGFKSFHGLASPQECQQKCQDERECVNFIWSNFDDPVGEPTCHLKTLYMMRRAWLGSGAFNDKYCPADVSRKCYNKEYKCLGANTCIWCSPQWLSGPKFCYPSVNGPISNYEEYPVCDGIDHYNFKAEPLPFYPTRPPGLSTFPPRDSTEDEQFLSEPVDPGMYSGGA